MLTSIADSNSGSSLTNRDQALQALNDLQDAVTGANAQAVDAVQRRVDAVNRLYKFGNLSSLVFGLPFWLSLKGQAFSLEHHFPLEPMYKRFDVPQLSVLQCGRQIAKSTTLAARGILRAAMTPYYNQLFVTPFYEQIRRFSTNAVRPFLDKGALHDELIGTTRMFNQNVLQRTFRNGSSLFFSFTFGGADRVRGLFADELNVDEAQDTDSSCLPELAEVLSASHKYGLQTFSGTPKSSGTLLAQQWGQTTQSEWVTPCTACNLDNIASWDQHLDKMVHDFGIGCAQCHAPIDPRTGFFEHRYPDRQNVAIGLHIPQQIMPWHYGSPNAWAKLLKKREKYPLHKYKNEVCGEAEDTGNQLITEAHLRACCQLTWKMDLKEALAKVGNYSSRTMGVDWSGGAGGTTRRKGTQLIVEEGSPSFTVIVITGFGPRKLFPDVIYAELLPPSMPPEVEAQRVIYLARLFNIRILSHDFGGAGNLRESMLLQAGFPAEAIMPCMYTAMTASPVVNYTSPSDSRPRGYYSVDKSRSLYLLCHLIRKGMLHTPEWESGQELYLHWMSLYEDRHESMFGAETTLIRRHPKYPDDFCNAVNYACLAHWHTIEAFPDLAAMFGINLLARLDMEQLMGQQKLTVND